jgi:hypothetical protein
VLGGGGSWGGVKGGGGVEWGRQMLHGGGVQSRWFTAGPHCHRPHCRCVSRLGFCAVWVCIDTVVDNEGTQTVRSKQVCGGTATALYT